MKVYTADILEKHFGFSKKFFPLFATLLGNNYIKRNKVIDNFIEKNCNEKNIMFSDDKYIMIEKKNMFFKDM